MNNSFLLTEPEEILSLACLRFLQRSMRQYFVASRRVVCKVDACLRNHMLSYHGQPEFYFSILCSQKIFTGSHHETIQSRAHHKFLCPENDFHICISSTPRSFKQPGPCRFTDHTFLLNSHNCNVRYLLSPSHSIRKFLCPCRSNTQDYTKNGASNRKMSFLQRVFHHKE